MCLCLLFTVPSLSAPRGLGSEAFSACVVTEDEEQWMCQAGGALAVEVVAHLCFSTVLPVAESDALSSHVYTFLGFPMGHEQAGMQCCYPLFSICLIQMEESVSLLCLMQSRYSSTRRRAKSN